MVSSLAIVWSLLPSALVHVVHASLSGQEVLQDQVNFSGVLRRLIPGSSNERDMDALVEAVELAGVDIWQVSQSHVDVYIPPSYDPAAIELVGNGLSYSDSALPSQLLQPPTRISGTAGTWDLTYLTNATFHADYHPLTEVERFMQELVELHSDVVTLVNIGHSAEGREMWALEFSKEKGLRKKRLGNETEGAQNARKIGFLLTGAQHAREWIATSTAMYLAHALSADPSESYSLSNLLNYFDFYIVLVPNPDGYVYTWETDRFWYKNRQVMGPNAKCVGLDMNRNWGHKWRPTARFPLHIGGKKKKKTSPTDPCSHWYPGHRAFESPEVNHIANYVTTLPAIQAFIDLRSYGQMLSAPFSYSCKKVPKDAEDQIEAAMGASRAIKEVHGTAFTTGRLCSMLYRAPGNVVDYMYAKAGIKFAYAAHLRDTGTYGFALPPEWIRPVGEETVNMIKSLASFIAGRKF